LRDGIAIIFMVKQSQKGSLLDLEDDGTTVFTNFG
jgi:hypothetical protein